MKVLEPGFAGGFSVMSRSLMPGRSRNGGETKGVAP
jgi:hypothetical protein